MKKFLATLLIVGSLFFVPTTVEAAIETYIGEGSATMGDDESLAQAVERAKAKAIRNAQEQAGVYILSQADSRNLKLTDGEVDTLTAAVIKITDTKITKTMTDDGVMKIFVTITVELDTDALQSKLDKHRGKRKPVETPAVKTYTCEGSATMSEAESQAQAVERAKAKAVRNAQEQAGLYIRSQASSRNLKLSDSEVDTLAATVIKITDTKITKTMTDYGAIQVFVTVTVELDTDILNSKLDEIARQRKR